MRLMGYTNNETVKPKHSVINEVILKWLYFK